MNIDKIKRVYLLGIGGIGMSGLARYFSRLGCEVAGYDRTSTELTRTLEAEGMPISYADDVDSVPASFKAFMLVHESLIVMRSKSELILSRFSRFSSMRTMS